MIVLHECIYVLINLSLCYVRTDSNACGSNPCVNGYCSNTNNGTSYKCTCYFGYSGRNCENGKGETTSQ